jgi:hypothetical protein
MAAVHLTGLAAPLLGLVVKALALLCLAANVLVVRRLARVVVPDRPVAEWTAVVLTALSAPLLFWAVMGFEVALLVLLADLALLGLARWRVQDGWRGLVVPSAWLALAVWVRLDAAVVAMVAVLYVTWRARDDEVLMGLVPLLAVGASLAVQTALRLALYDQWLPNTYYLKMTGYPVLLRVAAGSIWLGLAAWGPGLLVELPALGWAVLRKDHRLWLLVGVVGTQCAYSAWVGGDAWEENGLANRFVAVGLPAFAVIIGGAFARLAERPPFGRPLVVGLLVALAALALEGRGQPERTAAWLTADLPYKSDDARELVALSRALSDVTTPEARVAVVWAGFVPYLTDRPCIDLLGKCDAVIAQFPAHGFDEVGQAFSWRNPTGDAWGHFYPGHLKWHYRWSVGRLKPDVIAQQWGPPADLAPYLNDYQPVALGGDPRLTVALRKGSPNVRWDRLTGH